MIKAYRTIFSSSIGNILEWYDFGLFAINSALFSQLFFPNTSHQTSLIETFGVFAVGFLCRPLGALIFGYFGDTEGRAKTLRLSILMISLPTLFIGFLPTYAQIGIAAPILLTLTRIWQGISIGGEYSGSLIYLAETAPSRLRATITSFASMGANLGILLAMVVGSICTMIFTEAAFQHWGWRVPYMLSGILSLLIYFTRLNLRETHVFRYMAEKKLLAINPIRTMFTKNMPDLMRTLGLVCLGSTYYYFCFIYLPIFLNTTMHYSTSTISKLMTSLFLSMLVLIPIAGYICDKIGRRGMLVWSSAAVAVLVIPGFALLHSNHFIVVFIVMFLFTLLSSIEQASKSVVVVETYPVPARYTGLSFSYNLGNGVLGGTVPVVCAWLVAYFHAPLGSAYYIAFCAVITYLVAYFYVPETKGISLT